MKAWKEAQVQARIEVDRLMPQIVLDDEYDEQSEERMEMISTH